MNKVVFCKNCRSDIPTPVWDIHEIACERQRWYCEACERSLPKNEREQHNQDYHAMILCECGEQVETRETTNHKKTDCSHRLVECMYCECLTFHCKLSEHESVCGSRTEPCEYCNERVQLRHLATHICKEATPPPDSPDITAHVSTPAQLASVPHPAGDDLVICPFCMSPTTDYTLLQEHIFSEHPEVVVE